MCAKKTSQPPLSTSVEDYLERIHELTESKGYARVADIAAALEIAPPSVSAMVQRMAKAGFLNYERYRGLTLTPVGQAAALGIRRRHKILSEFLTAIGVPLAQAEKDIEGLEHHLSTVAVEKIEALLPKLCAKQAMAAQASPRVDATHQKQARSH